MRKTGVASRSVLESWTGPKSEAINSETGKFTYGIKNPYAGRLIYGCCLSQQVLLEVAANHPRYETLESEYFYFSY